MVNIFLSNKSLRTEKKKYEQKKTNEEQWICFKRSEELKQVEICSSRYL